MLLIFGGLPGCGKSTLGSHLAPELRAMPCASTRSNRPCSAAGQQIPGPEGYLVAYEIAVDNRTQSQTVIADSVNPIDITRSAWRDVALRSGVPALGTRDHLQRPG